jgi:hypothetical protein
VVLPYTFYLTWPFNSCLGGCGEQLDIWEEGQVSEFGMYGVGVTNYFKFLKFLVWLFIILFVVSLPVLVLNIYGPFASTAGLAAPLGHRPDD